MRMGFPGQTILGILIMQELSHLLHRPLIRSVAGDKGLLLYRVLHNIIIINRNADVVGKESWNIKEINEAYTAVQIAYRVTCKGEENESDTYNVKEF